MIKTIDRAKTRQKRRARVRAKISGTPSVPRLNVFRSNTNIYAQLIDDVNRVTICSASTLKTDKGCNIEGAKYVGTVVAEAAKAKGVTKIVFDRGGYLYHGKIQALADAAREAGLEF